MKSRDEEKDVRLKWRLISTWKKTWVSVWMLLLVSHAITTSSLNTVCSTDLDCSLNGVCSSIKENKKLSHEANDTLRQVSHGTETKTRRVTYSGAQKREDVRRCFCDEPWFGTNCDKIKFSPIKGRSSTENESFLTIDDQGYGMAPNRTTWGGGILTEHINATTKVYHLYVSRMTNNCPLKFWQTNSRIDHAISTNIQGPYEFVDVAIPTFSHNPSPVILSKNEEWNYAIFHIGNGIDGENGGKNCSSTLMNMPPSEKASRNLIRQGIGSTIHVSNSLHGPWVPLQRHGLGTCNNPAPWVHPYNGTLYVACGDGKIRRSHSVRGPYQVIAEFPNDHSPKVAKAYEDPCLYTDARGHYHCIYHAYERYGGSQDCTDSLVSAHAYSQDGFEWHLSPTPPYGSTVEVYDKHNKTRRKDVILASRERPKIYIDRQTGRLTHLVQGVCGSPRCDPSPYKPWCVHCKYQEWDFTLVSALDGF